MPFVFSESELTAPSIIEQAPAVVDWRALWRKLKKAVSWQLEYFNGSQWIDKRVLLDIDRIFPYENTSKITLNFHSKRAGAYRLTFGIKKYIQEYINKTSFFQYNLTYNDLTLVFDWRDLKEIPNLIFKHGFKNGFFWFRIQHNNIPANFDVSLDPTLIITQVSSIATARTNQLKTFQNRRGQRYYYTMFFNESSLPDYKLVIYKSQYGINWQHETTLHTFGVGEYESSSLWISEDAANNQLLIYFVYTDSTTLYYNQGNISDSLNSITLGNEQEIESGIYYRPTITLAEDGYVWITAEAQIGGYYPEIYIKTFGASQEDWQTNGTTPYLKFDDYPTNYVYNDGGSDGDEHKYWLFNAYVTSSPSEVLVWFNCTSSGNDEFDVTFYVGDVWRYAGTIQPNSSWAYHSIECSFLLNTASKVNNSPMGVYYDRQGAADDVYIDRAYMEVTTTAYIKIEIFFSEYALYFPEASDFYHFTLANDYVNNPKPALILPLHAVDDVIVLWRVENASSEYVLAKQASFNGLVPSVSNEFSIRYQISGGHLVEEYSHLRAVVDSENAVHTIAWRFTGGGSGVYLYSKFIADQGFGTTQAIPELTDSRKAMSMSIDTTVTPNIVYAFYTYFADAKAIYWKSTAINDMIWANAYEHDFYGGGSTLRYLTASYDAGAYNNIQMVFTNRFTARSVFWNQIPIIPPPTIDDDLIFILFLLFIVVLSIGAVLLKKKH